MRFGGPCAGEDPTAALAEFTVWQREVPAFGSTAGQPGHSSPLVEWWALSLPSAPQCPLMLALQEDAPGGQMQAQGRAGGEPQLALPAPSRAPLPLHPGLGPQARLHGNRSSACWGFPGVSAPREGERKMHQRKQRLPRTWEGPVVRSVTALAQ